ncbi:MAG: nucleotidyltransferase domain-containing protein [Kiritimatiellae bacterium]|jgi:predicted nucleotidyltransferase|nr:nucleotidyltransferase domain-containing protein [Kiritimatiellia bacterium]
MRITTFEKQKIKACFHRVFGDGNIFLFGSRINDSAKGGDIDLFVEPCVKTDLKRKKIKFLAQLDLEIGEQKIDVVLQNGNNSDVVCEAKSKGIKL